MRLQVASTAASAAGSAASVSCSSLACASAVSAARSSTLTGRAAVAQSDDEETHAGITAGTSPSGPFRLGAGWHARRPERRRPRRLAAASSPALRCSWKARICSSMERSTLRTSTPSGTDSTVGAKLRMRGDAGGDQPVADLLGGAGRAWR